MPQDSRIILSEESLRERISAIRREKKISISKMAENVNMSRNAYSCIENGTTLLFNPVLGEIARVFDMSVDDIVFYNPDAKSPSKTPAAYELEMSRLKGNVSTLCNLIERLASRSLNKQERDSLSDMLQKISAEPGSSALKYLKKLDKKF
ncbi:MAG: helix-turn-helix transcriptional regulator [Bacteroidales bacterium]|nr:helix-turn-helix transcriptional regulator [Bacteroidales bacterium]